MTGHEGYGAEGCRGVRRAVARGVRARMACRVGLPGRSGLDGFGEVDGVAVGVLDVGYALAPGHVVGWAEDAAA